MRHFMGFGIVDMKYKQAYQPRGTVFYINNQQEFNDKLGDCETLYDAKTGFK